MNSSAGITKVGEGIEPVLVAVIGGGISGLTVSYELVERSQRLRQPVRIVCLEAAERAGGNIRTARSDGFLCEAGPNGFLDDSPCSLTLVRRLGLAERLVRADSSDEIRYIYRKGKLRRIPASPLSLLSSDIMPLAGRLRLLCEPLARRGKNAGDESIHEYARRRIGKTAAEILVGAMVGGVYAGDSRQLSLAATFPRMQKMERERGGLFRGLLEDEQQSNDAAGPSGRLTSFRDGLQELIDALATALGERLRLATPVASVADMGARGFRILLEEGAPLDVDAVVLACPAWHAAQLVAEMDGELAQAMAGIPNAPLAVIHQGFSTAALGDQWPGLGFLAPRNQGIRSLGTIWASNLFEGRAPEGRCLLSTLVGGTLDPDAVQLEESALLELVRCDLERALGIRARPYFSRVSRHTRGIPQYNLGHLERLKKIAERLTEHPQLWACGSSYRGISINACVEEGPAIAEQLLDIAVRRSQEALG